MNFLGHATVAAWRDRSAPFLLGAMLPDFCSMARARLAEVADEEVAAGVSLHHATDAVFHDAPSFLRLCAAGVAELTDLGVDRGGARAVAHVGIELLLDGELVANEAPCAEYLEALALAREDRLGAGIRFRRPEHAARFQHVRARLEEWGVPDGYADPAFVAERVIGALRNRPRLALTPGDARLVRAWMPRAKVQVVADAGGLLNEVRAGLVHVDTSPSRRGILPAP